MIDDVVYVWKSGKLYGGWGSVKGLVFRDGGVLLVDEHGDFKREIGMEMDCRAISYFRSRFEAKEWLEKILNRKVDLIGYELRFMEVKE